MSMVNCERCDRYIDSDDDGDCFIAGPAKGETTILCESCREWEAQQAEALGERGTRATGAAGA